MNPLPLRVANPSRLSPVNFFRSLCLTTVFGLLTSVASAQITFVFDTTKDDAGFFTGANASRLSVLEDAAEYLSSFLLGHTFDSIIPAGGNTWSSTPIDPETSATTFSVSNATIAANTVRVYVGARTISGSTIAFGSQAAWSWSGATGATWENKVNYRSDPSSDGFKPNIGAISFDNPASQWYFDSDYTTVESFSGQYDFFSVAVHELVHILGMFNGSGTLPTGYLWTSKISGSSFTGTNSVTENGGNVAMHTDLDHWSEGKTSVIAGTTPVANTSQETLMDPTFNFNVRKYLTELDIAGLQDMGYTTNNSSILVNITAIPEPSTYALWLGILVLVWLIWSRRQPRRQLASIRVERHRR